MLKSKEIFSSNMAHSSDQDCNLIIAGTRITGDILSDNNILIEGEINGNIDCKGKVTIGDSGKVKGNISCFTSEIFGTIEGEIKVEDVLNLRDTSRIYGNIFTTKLKILVLVGSSNADHPTMFSICSRWYCYHIALPISTSFVSKHVFLLYALPAVSVHCLLEILDCFQSGMPCTNLC